MALRGNAVKQTYSYTSEPSGASKPYSDCDKGCPPPENSALQEIYQRLLSVQASVDTAKERVGCINARAFGEDDASPANPRPLLNSTVNGILALFHEIDRAACDLHDAIEKLTRLA